MKKVAFFASILETGGSERQWLELVKGLNRQKIEPVLFCLYRLGKIGREIQSLGVESHDGFLKGKFNFWSLRSVAAALARENVDVLFLMRDPLTLFYGITAARLAGIKAVHVAVHGWELKEKNFLNHISSRFLLRCSSKIIGICDKHREYIIKKELVDPKKVVAILNGTSLEEYKAEIDVRRKKESLGIADNCKVVGRIARLHRFKRHDIFLKAASVVIRTRPDTVFLIVGEGPERMNIERLVAELGLGRHVRILGLRSDIADINKVLDLAVLSSENETLPMTLIESMAAGVPVVATDVAFVSELVQHGINGYLVPVNDPEALAKAMLWLISNPGLSRQMGEEGRRIARERFSLEQMVRNYEDVFLSAC